MPARLLRVTALLSLSLLMVSLLTTAAQGARVPRVSGVVKIGQSGDSRLQLRWNPVRGARYQMRVAPQGRSLARAVPLAVGARRVSWTPRLPRTGLYVAQVRAYRGGAMGRWSRPSRFRLAGSAAVDRTDGYPVLPKPPPIPMPKPPTPTPPVTSPTPPESSPTPPESSPTPPESSPTPPESSPTPPESSPPSSPPSSGTPAMGPVSFSSVDAMKASGLFRIPSDANLVTWHFGTQTLEQAFLQLGAKDILVLPERAQPYYIDSSNGFMASGASYILGQDGKKIPVANTFMGKPAKTWFAMARATRGVIGLGPGAVIEPTNSGWTQEAQIPDKGSPLPGGGTSPGRYWWNTSGVKQGELIGAQEKLLESVDPNAYFANFTMHGRDFGGIAYNAISTHGGTLERLNLDGAWRGFEAVPNGETGAVTVTKGTYLISRVVMNPTDANGRRVGASPVMINNSPGGRWEYGDVREARAGMPTIWHSSGTHTFYQVSSRWGTSQAVNLEDTLDGFQFVMTGGALWPNRGNKGGHPAPDGIYGNGLHIGIHALGKATITLKDVDLDQNVQAGKLCVQLYGGTNPSNVKITDTNSGKSAPVAAYGSGGVVQTAN